jgi:competence ComEA-like helix-hairpin-helix protein
MPELTPAERRGARWFVALLLLGALHDGVRARFPQLAPPAAISSAPATAGPDPAGRDSAAGVPAPVAAPQLTDLNRATVAELDRLPGIGPVLARRIVEHRERLGAFHSTDELLGVPGIGVRLLERIRPHVTASR